MAINVLQSKLWYWKKSVYALSPLFAIAYRDLRQLIRTLDKFSMLQLHEVLYSSSCVGDLWVDFRLDVPLDMTIRVSTLSKLKELAQCRDLCSRIGRLQC